MTVPLGAASGDAAEEWVATWSASISERAASAQEMARRVAELNVTATGADGAVAVTVAGSGVMTDLRLDERVLRWSPDEIAAAILAVMRRAQGALAARVAEVAADTVGVDTETGRAVVSSFARRFPEPPPDDDGPEDRHDRDGGARA